MNQVKSPTPNTKVKRSNVLGTVYLIHFEKKIGHAKHYIGWTERPLEQRLKDHRTSGGSRLLRAAKLRGIKWTVVKTWENVDRHFERKLKKQKNSRHHCFKCGRRKIKAGMNCPRNRKVQNDNI